SIVGSDEPSYRNAGLRGGRLVIVGRILHGDNLVQVRRVLERPLTDHLAKLLPTQIARKEWHLAILPAGFSFHGSPYEQPGQYSWCATSTLSSRTDRRNAVSPAQPCAGGCRSCRANDYGVNVCQGRPGSWALEAGVAGARRFAENRSADSNRGHNPS